MKRLLIALASLLVFGATTASVPDVAQPVYKAPPPSIAEERVALVIGNDRYPNLPAHQQLLKAGNATQRVVLLEEDPQDPYGKQYVGSANWRTELVSPGPGLVPEVVVRADVEIPERRMTIGLSIRRNADLELPASHAIEITFHLPTDFPHGGISNVPGLLMKQTEMLRGKPLAGLAEKITTGFLIGLSAVESDLHRNMQLLKEGAWLDIPVFYADNQRAIIAIEKGATGERTFADAFAAWGGETGAFTE